jgi:hypothetical protein
MFGAIVAAATVESQRAVAVLAGVLIDGTVCKMERIKAAARCAKRPFRGVQGYFRLTFAPPLPQFSGCDARSA